MEDVTDLERRKAIPSKMYRPEEIIGKLRKADVLLSRGKNIADVVTHLGMTEVTYYRWRKEYRGEVFRARRLKELKKENAWLCKKRSGLNLGGADFSGGGGPVAAVTSHFTRSVSYHPAGTHTFIVPTLL